jgi:nitroreductase
MNAYKAIIGKRDRREYQSKPVADDVVHRILQAGRMAGSSSNSQPLRFVVLRDLSQKEKLAPAGPGTAPLVRAPLAIVICLEKGRRDFDVGRAAQNMMVAAWADGVHSCPIGLREDEITRPALEIPDEYAAAIGVAFGYPSGEASTGRASGPRLPMEELVHWERW